MAFRAGKIALATAFALVLTLQLVKGLSLEAHFYPLIYSLFSYANGPVRRGLLPTVLQGAGFPTIEAQAQAFAVLHFITLAVLVGLLVKYGRDHPVRSDQPLFWLRVLFLTGAPLPLLAATNFYGDALMVVGLLGTHMLLERRQRGAAALLLLLISLQHELMLVLALPLWLAHLQAMPDRRRAIVPLFAVLTFMAVFLTAASLNQPQLAADVGQLCTTARPTTIATFYNGWDQNCPYFLSVHMADEFKPMRWLALPIYLLTLGVLPFLLPVFWAQFYEKRAQGAGVTLALLLWPLLFIPVTADIDRMLVLGLCVGWLLLEPKGLTTLTPVPRAGQVTLALLAGLQLLLFYPSINFYAQHRLLPPAVSDQLFLSPQPWLVDKLGENLPPSLQPLYCADPRCAP